MIWLILLLLFRRSVTEEMIDSLPSALTKPTEKEDKVINCSVCLKKKSKLTNKADMYCYNCKDVFCDQHAGVSPITIPSRTFSRKTR